MRANYIYVMIVAIFLLASCSKDISIKDLEFDVSIDKTEYNKNDEVTFNFKGEPDMITFYSGLPGGRYEYKDRTIAEGKPVLTFTTAKNSGSQANTLSLMISSDFKGIVPGKTDETIANIANAQWDNITNRAALATSTTAKVSGDIDLSDKVTNGKNVYIAFKYTGVKGVIMNKWTITKLLLTNNLSDGTVYTIANLNANTAEILDYEVITYSPGWLSTIVKGKYNYVVTAGTSLVITGATSVAASTDDAETWAILGPIDLKKVSPDKGTSIKKYSENMSAFPFVFKYEDVTGDFKPTFVASNSSKDEQSQKTKTLSISIK
jgi:hypothetical protein